LRRIDARKLRIERARAELFQRGLVHERIEERANLVSAQVRQGGRISAAARLYQGAQRLLPGIVESREDADLGLVGRDLRRGEPGAVNVAVEVILRTNARIDVGKIDAGGERRSR
jgi:hypothetical protein